MLSRLILFLLAVAITFSTPAPPSKRITSKLVPFKSPLFQNRDGSQVHGKPPNELHPLKTPQATPRRQRSPINLPGRQKTPPTAAPSKGAKAPPPATKPGQKIQPAPQQRQKVPKNPQASQPGQQPGPKKPGSTSKVNYYYEPLPFPEWLSEFTGLYEWPGVDPPYIPLDFINFYDIPDIPLHDQAECQAPMLRSPLSCSFDCYNCVEFDDVYTCPQLSQTFDDGPLPSTLKLLDKFGSTKTTLFTLGVNIVRFPEIYRESHYRGHIMGSHTWSHKFLPSLSNPEIIAQIQWSIWAMNATAGHLPKWFRPPYGGIDNRIRAILRQFGMQAVLWDFDTFDWKMLDSSNNRNEGDIYHDVRKFKEKNGGKGLILEHDAIERTVDVGMEIHDILGGEGLTVPECVGGLDYIKTFQ